MCADPIPGGCNLELPLQNDPNLYLTTSAAQTHVKFAYGDLNVDGVREPCGSSSQHSVPVYEIYQLYLYEQHLDEEAFFAGISRMLTADDIAATARPVCCAWLVLGSAFCTASSFFVLLVCSLYCWLLMFSCVLLFVIGSIVFDSGSVFCSI